MHCYVATWVSLTMRAERRKTHHGLGSSKSRRSIGFESFKTKSRFGSAPRYDRKAFSLLFFFFSVFTKQARHTTSGQKTQGLERKFRVETRTRRKKKKTWCAQEKQHQSLFFFFFKTQRESTLVKAIFLQLKKVVYFKDNQKVRQVSSKFFFQVTDKEKEKKKTFSTFHKTKNKIQKTYNQTQVTTAALKNKKDLQLPFLSN